MQLYRFILDVLRTDNLALIVYSDLQFTISVVYNNLHLTVYKDLFCFTDPMFRARFYNLSESWEFSPLGGGYVTCEIYAWKL